MKHDKFQLNLLHLLDGELPAAQAAEMERHLSECPDCVRKLAAVRQVWKAACEAGRVEPPPFLHARIAARVREYETNRHFVSGLTGFLSRLAQRGALVFLVAGAVGVGIYLGRSASDNPRNSAQAGLSYLDIFYDLPPQSLGGVYITLAETAK